MKLHLYIYFFLRCKRRIYILILKHQNNVCKWVILVLIKLFHSYIIRILGKAKKFYLLLYFTVGYGPPTINDISFEISLKFHCSDYFFSISVQLFICDILGTMISIEYLVCFIGNTMFLYIPCTVLYKNVYRLYTLCEIVPA